MRRYYTRFLKFQSTIRAMNDKNTPQDFEGAWQSKLAAGLDKEMDPAQREKILDGGGLLTMESPTQDKIIWTWEMMERLEGITSENTRQEILTGCACHYPKDGLVDARNLYLETGDVDRVIDLLQGKFEGFLRDVLELEEELIEEITSRSWGLAGVREGSRIIATKIPKSGYLVEYFQTDDPQKKRKLYCHCPRVRDGVGDDPQLPLEYCYCGAGFYKGIWDTILEEPVRVEVLESVMVGGDVCTIAVHLPDSITTNGSE